MGPSVRRLVQRSPWRDPAIGEPDLVALHAVVAQAREGTEPPPNGIGGKHGRRTASACLLVRPLDDERDMPKPMKCGVQATGRPYLTSARAPERS